MNYYFLLEDEKSFIKVLPKWLEYMNFQCSRVVDIEHVTENNYVMQSGQGLYQLVDVILYQTMDTIIAKKDIIDYLIVILDAEEEKVEDRRKDVYQRINKYCNQNKIILNFEIKVIVCNHCFESWLLANEDIYPDEEPPKSSDFFPFYKHYNVREQDPEMLEVPDGIDDTTAKYHFHYLHEALRYKGVRYSKNKPNYVSTHTYFEALLHRINRTNHICTFKELCDYIREQHNK